MCELCVLPWDGTPGRVGPCALDPPLPPPGPVQAVIIGLAGSELHYLPWPTRAWGGPGACEPVRLGAGRGGVPTIPWRVGTNEQLNLPQTGGGQRTPSGCASPSPSSLTHLVLSSRLPITHGSQHTI